MKFETILHRSRTFLQQKLFLFGLLFWAVNATTSYALYQVNSYKIFLTLVGVTLLAAYVVWSHSSRGDHKAPFSLWLFLLLPILVTLPGYWYNQGKYNYNFDYELVTNLTLVIWVIFLYRTTDRVEDLRILFFLMGITLLYSCFWAWGELIDFDLLSLDLAQGSTMKSTFGNRNYFSGFLIQLLPLFLIFSIPDGLLSKENKHKQHRTFSPWNYFAIFVFLLTLGTILTAQSRAALGASIVSIFCSLSTYALFLSSPKVRKKILLTLSFFIVFLVVVFTAFYHFDPNFRESRLASTLSLEAWYGRLLPWEAAIASIQASPWIGHGLGSSYSLFFNFVPSNARLFHSEHSYNHAHSEYLEFLQEAGIIGGIILIFFWGYLFFQIYKVIRNNHSSFAQKVAIGIGGAFIAYLIQCFFSVAPRMMVVKFPLFTLIAIILILARLNSSKDSSLNTTNPIEFLPIFIGLALAWGLYIPWMAGQYEFVKIRKTRINSLHVGRLEKLVERRKDIYALSYLSHLNLQYGQLQKLEETIRMIDQTLPNYRDVGFMKAKLAYLNKNFPKAKQAALEYQKKDRYDFPAIYFLLELSAWKGDPQLFFEQVKLLTRRLAFSNAIPIQKKEAAVVVSQGNAQSILAVINSPSNMNFLWDQNFITFLFETAAKTQRDGKWKRKEKERFMRSFSYSLNKTPFFTLAMQKGFETEKKQMRTLAMQYLSLKQKRDQLFGTLSERFRRELASAPPERRKEVKIQHRATKIRWEKFYREKLKKLEEPLLHKTHWVEYLQRHQFARQIIQRLTQVAFPPVR